MAAVEKKVSIKKSQREKLATVTTAEQQQQKKCKQTAIKKISC